MIVKIACAAAALTMIAAVPSSATIYTYTGPRLTETWDSTLVPGRFEPGVRATGWFRLAAPFAPDLPWMTDVSHLVAEFEFWNGMGTISSAAGHPISIQVMTSENGEMLSWQIGAYTHQGTHLLEAVGDWAFFFISYSHTEHPVYEWDYDLETYLGSLDTMTAGICRGRQFMWHSGEEICHNAAAETAHSDGERGYWHVLDTPAPPAPIPLPASLPLLIGSMGLMAGLSLRRRKN